MSTEPSLLHNLKKDKPPKQWCVYFDDDEGDVDADGDEADAGYAGDCG